LLLSSSANVILAFSEILTGIAEIEKLDRAAVKKVNVKK